MTIMLVMDGIGTRLKQLREEQHLTQEQVAQAIGVQRAAISALERGEVHTMKWPHLKSAARFFRVSHEWLAEGTGDRRPKNAASLLSDRALDLAERLDRLDDNKLQAIEIMLKGLEK